MEPVDYLFVAAHPDDAEISAGGIIASLVSLGLKVGILDLTDGEPTPFGNSEIRAAESARAASLLGITWRENLGLPNRSLENSIIIREKLATIFRVTKPKVLLTHHPIDAHPDHVAASSIVDGARFWSKLTKTTMSGSPWYPPILLHFFSIHLKAMPIAKVVIDITDHFKTKIKVLECYHSQLIDGRIPNPMMPIEEIEAIALAWGRTIRSKYGEPLNSPEEIGLKSLINIC